MMSTLLFHPARLSVDPAPNQRKVADRARWFSSPDASAELPGLIAAVGELLDRVTLRIGIHGDMWQNIPRRIPARGRQVRIGWFRHIHPRAITVSFATGEPVMLRIIPSRTAAGAAEATLKLTAPDGAGLSIDARPRPRALADRLRYDLHDLIEQTRCPPY
ncbi:DUF5994 family protein [Nonomuraea sp. NPDC049607]|uniref:DUF5994 family protein n=1 Tax=Nonomuraea sp. NPDC049607 TaxID=3154732 RepID=UPI0034165285